MREERERDGQICARGEGEGEIILCEERGSGREKYCVRGEGEGEGTRKTNLCEERGSGREIFAREEREREGQIYAREEGAGGTNLREGR